MVSFTFYAIEPLSEKLFLHRVVKIISNDKAAPAHEAEGNDYMLTKEQLAMRINVSLRTVEYWMERKLVPHVKPTGMVRFIWPDVERALRRNFGVGYPPGTAPSSRR